MANPWDVAWDTPVLDKFIWEWDVVGGGLLVVRIPKEVSWFKRIRTKAILGSKWKRLRN